MIRTLAVTLLSLAGFAGLSPALAADYEVEPHHTFVTFEVLHNGTSTTRGRFDAIEGRVSFDPAARSGQADIRIDTASVDSGSDPFDEHLRGADFLHIAQFPEARFQSTAFVFDGERLAAVRGRLTLLGAAHEVELRAERFNCYQNARIGREVCGGDFQAEIQRSQWGMGFGLPGIPDAVRLVVQIEAIRQ
ncbi:YceI family protein [Castellaniella sp. GW247-6E4]|uniref:YceI family protein n=1 Tax=Castellaniella sp. GW247-6E4 TaxID=3140380 RepID=UPI0033150D5A